MVRSARVVTLVLLGAAASIATAHPLPAADEPGSGAFFSVIPFEFDPAATRLVASQWKGGIGCPTDGRVSTDGRSTSPYTDPACATGPADHSNHGLLLAKTGPTSNFAAAGASLKGVKGRHLTELGYDIRKPGAIGNPAGSHCGAGAPRFDVITTDGVDHFVGCTSPPPSEETAGIGFIRLRWNQAQLAAAFPPILPTDVVRSIDIIFDEGQDASGAPDSFGLAVLDNIDVNGVLVGRGPMRPDERDRDEGRGEDQDRRHYEFHSSQSRPEASSLSFDDPAAAVKVQSLDGARNITYSGTCVSFVADAAFNGDPDHVVSFSSCDLSAVAPLPGAPAGIGNYTIAVTGPAGVVYQAAGTLVSGSVALHK